MSQREKELERIIEDLTVQLQEAQETTRRALEQADRAIAVAQRAIAVTQMYQLLYHRPMVL